MATGSVTIDLSSNINVTQSYNPSSGVNTYTIKFAPGGTGGSYLSTLTYNFTNIPNILAVGPTGTSNQIVISPPSGFTGTLKLVATDISNCTFNAPVTVLSYSINSNIKTYYSKLVFGSNFTFHNTLSANTTGYPTKFSVEIGGSSSPIKLMVRNQYISVDTAEFRNCNLALKSTSSLTIDIVSNSTGLICESISTDSTYQNIILNLTQSYMSSCSYTDVSDWIDIDARSLLSINVYTTPIGFSVAIGGGQSGIIVNDVVGSGGFADNQNNYFIGSISGSYTVGNIGISSPNTIISYVANIIIVDNLHCVIADSVFGSYLSTLTCGNNTHVNFVNCVFLDGNGTSCMNIVDNSSGIAPIVSFCPKGISNTYVNNAKSHLTYSGTGGGNSVTGSSLVHSTQYYDSAYNYNSDFYGNLFVLGGSGSGQILNCPSTVTVNTATGTFDTAMYDGISITSAECAPYVLICNTTGGYTFSNNELPVVNKFEFYVFNDPTNPISCNFSNFETHNTSDSPMSLFVSGTGTTSAPTVINGTYTYGLNLTLSGTGSTIPYSINGDNVVLPYYYPTNSTGQAYVELTNLTVTSSSNNNNFALIINDNNPNSSIQSITISGCDVILNALSGQKFFSGSSTVNTIACVKCYLGPLSGDGSWLFDTSSGNYQSVDLDNLYQYSQIYMTTTGYTYNINNGYATSGTFYPLRINSTDHSNQYSLNLTVPSGAQTQIQHCVTCLLSGTLSDPSGYTVTPLVIECEANVTATSSLIFEMTYVGTCPYYGCLQSSECATVKLMTPCQTYNVDHCQQSCNFKSWYNIKIEATNTGSLIYHISNINYDTFHIVQTSSGFNPIYKLCSVNSIKTTIETGCEIIIGDSCLSNEHNCTDNPVIMICGSGTLNFECHPVINVHNVGSLSSNSLTGINGMCCVRLNYFNWVNSYDLASTSIDSVLEFREEGIYLSDSNSGIVWFDYSNSDKSGDSRLYFNVIDSNTPTVGGNFYKGVSLNTDSGTTTTVSGMNYQFNCPADKFKINGTGGYVIFDAVDTTIGGTGMARDSEVDVNGQTLCEIFEIGTNDCNSQNNGITFCSYDSDGDGDTWRERVHICLNGGSYQFGIKSYIINSGVIDTGATTFCDALITQVYWPTLSSTLAFTDPTQPPQFKSRRRLFAIDFLPYNCNNEVDNLTVVHGTDFNYAVTNVNLLHSSTGGSFNSYNLMVGDCCAVSLTANIKAQSFNVVIGTGTVSYNSDQCNNMFTQDSAFNYSYYGTVVNPIEDALNNKQITYTLPTSRFVTSTLAFLPMTVPIYLGSGVFNLDFCVATNSNTYHLCNGRYTITDDMTFPTLSLDANCSIIAPTGGSPDFTMPVDLTNNTTFVAKLTLSENIALPVYILPIGVDPTDNVNTPHNQISANASLFTYGGDDVVLADYYNNMSSYGNYFSVVNVIGNGSVSSQHGYLCIQYTTHSIYDVNDQIMFAITLNPSGVTYVDGIVSTTEGFVDETVDSVEQNTYTAYVDVNSTEGPFGFPRISLDGPSGSLISTTHTTTIYGESDGQTGSVLMNTTYDSTQVTYSLPFWLNSSVNTSYTGSAYPQHNYLITTDNTDFTYSWSIINANGSYASISVIDGNTHILFDGTFVGEFQVQLTVTTNQALSNYNFDSLHDVSFKLYEQTLLQSQSGVVDPTATDTHDTDYQIGEQDIDTWFKFPKTIVCALTSFTGDVNSSVSSNQLLMTNNSATYEFYTIGKVCGELSINIQSTAKYNYNSCETGVCVGESITGDYITFSLNGDNKLDYGCKRVCISCGDYSTSLALVMDNDSSVFIEGSRWYMDSQISCVRYHCCDITSCTTAILTYDGSYTDTIPIANVELIENSSEAIQHQVTISAGLEQSYDITLTGTGGYEWDHYQQQPHCFNYGTEGSSTLNPTTRFLMMNIKASVNSCPYNITENIGGSGSSLDIHYAFQGRNSTEDEWTDLVVNNANGSLSTNNIWVFSDFAGTMVVCPKVTLNMSNYNADTNILYFCQATETNAVSYTYVQVFFYTSCCTDVHNDYYNLAHDISNKQQVTSYDFSDAPTTPSTATSYSIGDWMITSSPYGDFYVVNEGIIYGSTGGAGNEGVKFKISKSWSTDDTVVMETVTQTLTNKTITGCGNVVRAEIIGSHCNAVGVTGTYSTGDILQINDSGMAQWLPYSSSVTQDDAVQVLTNKTITACSNYVRADEIGSHCDAVGVTGSASTGNILLINGDGLAQWSDFPSTVTMNDSVQSLTHKTITDSTNLVRADQIGSSANAVGVTGSASTGNILLINGSGLAQWSDFPSTVTMNDSVQSLTHKTITDSTNLVRADQIGSSANAVGVTGSASTGNILLINGSGLAQWENFPSTVTMNDSVQSLTHKTITDSTNLVRADQIGSSANAVGVTGSASTGNILLINGSGLAQWENFPSTITMNDSVQSLTHKTITDSTNLVRADQIGSSANAVGVTGSASTGNILLINGDGLAQWENFPSTITMNTTTQSLTHKTITDSTNLVRADQIGSSANAVGVTGSASTGNVLQVNSNGLAQWSVLPPVSQQQLQLLAPWTSQTGSSGTVTIPSIAYGGAYHITLFLNGNFTASSGGSPTGTINVRGDFIFDARTSDTTPTLILALVKSLTPVNIENDYADISFTVNTNTFDVVFSILPYTSLDSTIAFDSISVYYIVDPQASVQNFDV